MVEVLGSALAIIASLVGAVVLVLKVNFKLSNQTLKAKKDLYQERFENLKLVTNGLELALKETNLKLDEAIKESKAARSELIKTKDEMKVFVESTEKQIMFLREQIIKLGGDTFMVTSSKGKDKL